MDFTLIGLHDIPEKCPNPQCTSEALEVEVLNYSALWHDGDICCVACGQYIRGTTYDAH